MIVSDHMAKRMAERGITREEAERIVRSNHPTEAGDNGNVVYVGYGNGGKRIKVVTSPDLKTLVTAFKC